MVEGINISKINDNRDGTSIPSINLSGADNLVDSDEFTEIKAEKSELETVDSVRPNNDQYLPSPPPITTTMATTTQAQRIPIDDKASVTNLYVCTHDGFPRPEPPRGLLLNVSHSSPPPMENKNATIDSPLSTEIYYSIGKYIKQRSASFSGAITRRLSFKENENVSNGSSSFSSSPTRSTSWSSSSDHQNHVTELKLSGVKVIVERKNNDARHNSVNSDDCLFNPSDLHGRVTFYSRSNCRDCSAVRSFVRSFGLSYVEINIDVFRSREKEMVERTGSSTVPQIFFNEKLIGGLVPLNSMRNSGELEKRLIELLSAKCPDDDVPVAPGYGYDDDDDDDCDDGKGEKDRMDEIYRVLKCQLDVQDRLIRMRMVKNCFTGSELVEVLMRYLECGHVRAVEIGKELAKQHFIHHVFGGNDEEFQDGNQSYRLITHEPFIPKCYNFRGYIDEPRPASDFSLRLTKFLFAIIESYVSEDRHHVDYESIGKSEEFRRYSKWIQHLHRTEILALSPVEKLAFFMNLYNAMVIHAVIRIGHPKGLMGRKYFMTDFQYLIGGQGFSISAIKNGILRSNRRPPYSLVRPFINGDRRLKMALPSFIPLIHFGLCDGTRSSPALRFFTPQNVEAELRNATREFFQLQQSGIEVDLDTRTVHLPRLINWFSSDFGDDKEQILKWIINYVDASKAGLLTHLLRDGRGPVAVSYIPYDWSLNS